MNKEMNQLCLTLVAALFFIAGCKTDDEARCETWSVTSANIVRRADCGGSTFIHTDTLTYCNTSIPKGIRENDTVNRRITTDSCYDSYEVWNKRLQ